MSLILLEFDEEPKGEFVLELGCEVEVLEDGCLVLCVPAVNVDVDINVGVGVFDGRLVVCGTVVVEPVLPVFEAVVELPS